MHKEQTEQAIIMVNRDMSVAGTMYDPKFTCFSTCPLAVPGTE
jgi:hypothetical protein